MKHDHELFATLWGMRGQGEIVMPRTTAALYLARQLRRAGWWWVSEEGDKIQIEKCSPAAFWYIVALWGEEGDLDYQCGSEHYKIHITEVGARGVDIPYGGAEMPKLPSEYSALPDGQHSLTAVEYKTVEGKYGLQEEIACVNQDNLLTRIWIPHNSRKRIDQAAACGLVEIRGDEWNVVVGAKFNVLVHEGKVLAMLKG